MKRGVLYLHWGESRAALDRSLVSLRAHHPELPVHVAELPADSSLLDKARMAELSPFEETLFLDCDTVVLGRLDFAFAMARKHGLACAICEHPWAQRYNGLRDLNGRGTLVEYNTGVLCWTPAARPVFQRWRDVASTLDSSILFYRNGQLVRMPFNDQAGFALAIAEQDRAPFILPLNWNFRPSWHKSWWGPIKIWHDYREPPAELVAFSRQQQEPGAILDYRELTGF